MNSTITLSSPMSKKMTNNSLKILDKLNKIYLNYITDTNWKYKKIDILDVNSYIFNAAKEDL